MTEKPKDVLTINVHESKIYKSYEQVKSVFDKVKEHIPNFQRAELQAAIDNLGEEAELISINHANFYGLCKQYKKRMNETGLDENGIPRDDNGKIVVFKSQAMMLDTLLKLINALGTYYDTK